MSAPGSDSIKVPPTVRDQVSAGIVTIGGGEICDQCVVDDAGSLGGRHTHPPPQCKNPTHATRESAQRMVRLLQGKSPRPKCVAKKSSGLAARNDSLRSFSFSKSQG